MKPQTFRFAFTTLLAAGAAALVAVPSTARAQGYGTQQGPNTALIEARKAIQAADADVRKMKADMLKIKTRVQAKYETKEEWEQAQKTLKAAEAADAAAKKRAVAKLLSTPAYKAAKEKLTKADQQVQDLEAQGDKANAKQLQAAQQARIDAGLVIRKLEADALANDAKVAEAKEKLAEAKKEWEALQDEVKQALEQDAEYLAAQEQLEQAQANVKQMKLQLAQQQAQEAANRRAQAESERQSRRSSSGRGGAGGPGRGY